MSELQEYTLKGQPSSDVGVLDIRFDKDQPLVHFRGIKYASISERFAAPVLVNRHQGESFQSTKFGYVLDCTITWATSATKYFVRADYSFTAGLDVHKSLLMCEI